MALIKQDLIPQVYSVSCVLLSSNRKMTEIPLSHSENEKLTQNTVYFWLSYREWNCWVTKDVMLPVSQPVSKCTHRPITFRALTDQRSHMAPPFTRIILPSWRWLNRTNKTAGMSRGERERSHFLHITGCWNFYPCAFKVTYSNLN